MSSLCQHGVLERRGECSNAQDAVARSIRFWQRTVHEFLKQRFPKTLTKEEGVDLRTILPVQRLYSQLREGALLLLYPSCSGRGRGGVTLLVP